MAAAQCARAFVCAVGQAFELGIIGAEAGNELTGRESLN
jgi:hypothetical protein